MWARGHRSAREKRRRSARIFWVSVLVLLLVSAALGTIIWYELPSLRQVREEIADLKLLPPRPLPQQTPQRNRSGTGEAERTGTGTSSGTESATTQAAADVQPGTQSAGSALPPRVVSFLVNRYVLAEGPAIRVCDHLPDVPRAVPSSQAAFNRMMIDRATQVSENSFVESALVPIGALLQLPNAGQVVQQWSIAQNEGDTSYVRGENFRAALANASADAIAAKPALELAAQRAYHLFVMSRAASISPDIANDADATDLCSRIEALASRAAVAELPRGDLARAMNGEKAEILRFLASYSIAPEQVGFDPNLRNEPTIRFTGAGVTYSVPWMARQFGGPVRINGAPQDRTPEVMSGARATQTQ